MKITAKTKICIVIGDPVEHSLSPKMHNAAYKKLGIEDEFVYIGAHVQADNLKKAIEGIRTLKISGVSVTIPHKETLSKYLDQVDEVAEKIGAVNTIVNNNGILKGYNTDWIGVVVPLEKITKIKNKNVAILGAGGASRAAAYGMKIKGANIMYFNRTLEKAKQLEKEFEGKAYPLDEIEKITNADIIINATSIGLNQTKNESPLSTDYISSNQIVFDLVYANRGETKLVAEAKMKGAKTISGIEMLLHQGLAQFKLFTGIDAPEEAMRGALS